MRDPRGLALPSPFGMPSSFTAQSGAAPPAGEPITYTVLDPHNSTSGWTATAPTTISVGAPVYGTVGSIQIDLNNGGGGGVPINIQKNATTWAAGLSATDLIAYAIDPPANPIDGEVGAAGIVFAANHAHRGNTGGGEPAAGGTGARHGARWFSMAADSIREGSWAGNNLTSVPAGTTMQRLTYTPTNVVGGGNVRMSGLINITARRRPILCMTFDDGYQRELTEVIPMMEARFGTGIAPGSSYIPMGLVGTADRYTLTDLAAMKAKGWGMALDSNFNDEPVWAVHGGSVADAVAALNAHRAALVATGLATVQEASHVCFSYGPTDYNSATVQQVANCSAVSGSSTITTSTAAGFFNTTAMRGTVVLGAGVPADTKILSCPNATTIIVDKVLPTLTNIQVTFCAVNALTTNGGCVCNATTTVTSIRTTALVVGMTVQGRDVPAGTTITAINTPSTGTAADGTITVSAAIPATCTRLACYLAGAEWLPGNYEAALIAAGYRTGRRTKAFGGICTQLGIPSAMAMMSLTAANFESSSASTIGELTQNIRDGRDTISLMHVNSSYNAVALGEVLDFVAARVTAGELDIMNLNNWYNRIAARSGL
jgi:hypothetical protein